MGRLLTLVILFLTPLSLAQQPGKTVTYPDLLQCMTDMDWLWLPPAAGEKNIQFSSYDRGSDKGLGIQEWAPRRGPKGWYANGDCSKYLREEKRDGKTEYVMADIKGPGAIVRIWSANPKGNLFFYLDGATEPSWSVDFKKLTGGKLPSLPEPLAGIRSRGWNCHAPFPFAKHLKVTASTNGFYYQVNLRLFPPATKVETFRPEMLVEHAALLQETGARLLGKTQTFPAKWQRQVKGTLQVDPINETVEDINKTGIDFKTPGILREFTLQIIPGKGSPLDLRNTLRRILICVTTDGHPTLRVPVGDFFGSAPDFLPYRSYPLGVTPEGKGYCRFPMPMHKNGRLALYVDGPLPPTSYTLTATFDPGPVPKEALAFRAGWHIRKKVRTRPFSDFRVLNTMGRGRFVGCNLVVANPTPAWWGEGDEKFFVDGETFPSTFGTGTEDYFGYAWCCNKTFTSPYHAQPQCDGPRNFGYSCVNRYQLPDSIPFQKSFLFDMEIWHWKDVYVDYAMTAYWYGSPNSASGLPSIPDYEYRVVEDIPKPKTFRMKGAIEGETLKVLSCTGGKHQVQELAGYGERKWSNDRQVWWQGGKPGDRLTLALPVKQAGTYRIIGGFTKAVDYGIVQIWLQGRKLGKPLDGFNDGVIASGPLTLGKMELPAGQVELVIELTGCNPKAVTKYMAGLDYIKLLKL